MSRTVTLRDTSTDLRWSCPDCGRTERLTKNPKVKAFSYLCRGFETTCFVCQATFTTLPETPTSQAD